MNRRRVAIGVFATIRDAEATIARLEALGIIRYECSFSPDQPSPDAGKRQAAGSSNGHVPPPESVMLRIYLETMVDEQLVVTALLDSAARSVQLHDVDPPAS